MLKMEDYMVQYFTDRLQYRVVEMLGSEWMVKEIGSAEFYHSLEITNFIAFFLQFHYFCCLHDDILWVAIQINHCTSMCVFFKILGTLVVNILNFVH